MGCLAENDALWWCNKCGCILTSLLARFSLLKTWDGANKLTHAELGNGGRRDAIWKTVAPQTYSAQGIVPD